MGRADWTYELPPVAGDSVWLEQYLVYDRDGEPVGKVFAVLDHEGRRWLGIEREPLPALHDRRVVAFEAIGETDHEHLAIHLSLGADELDSALELDPWSGVEEGGEARRVTSVPPDELPPRQSPTARGPADQPGVLVAGIVGAFGMLALLAVFIFWSSSSAALPYFAVPGVLFGTALFLGYRAWSQPRSLRG
jgi:hypothetical protein